MKIMIAQTGMLNVNTYYVSDEEAKKGFIIDPGGYDDSLAEKIKKDSVSLEYIILTHGHFDHTGGVEGFMKKFPEAKLVASEAEAKTISDEFTPDLCVKDGEVVNVGGMELKFILTPGHTAGGMCVYVENCLFSGDTLFAQSIGRTDLAGGSFAELMNSIKKKLFTLPEDTKVFPGHMGQTEIGFEKSNNPFVRN